MFDAYELNRHTPYALKEEIDYLVKEGGLIYARSPFIENPHGGIVMLGAGPGVLALAVMRAFIDDVEKMPMLTVVDNSRIDYAQDHLKAMGVPDHKMRLKIYDSAGYGELWEHGPISLLIVDADHSTEAVLCDIDAWFPHIARSGLIFFHDVLEREGGFNGTDAWRPGSVSVALAQRTNLPWKLEAVVGISAVYRKQ